MSNFKDLSGQTFGYLTVIQRDTSQSYKRTHWICKCKCGNETSVIGHQLISGRTISCGCRRYETKNQTHGMRHSRIYSIWNDMKKRCYNPKAKSYPHYGGRGISVCSEWKTDFMAFYNWSMQHGYTDNLSIERINVDGDYTPDNCKWITFFEQQSNKTTSRLIECNGENIPISEVMRRYNLSRSIAYCRYKSAIKHKGSCNLEDLLTRPKFKPIYTERYKNRNSCPSRLVNQYSKNGEFIKQWYLKDVADAGFNHNAVITCCQGKAKTSGGYVWKYAD